MLQNAAAEMRQFQKNSPEAKVFEESWLERFALRLGQASCLGEASSAEREILAIGRSSIDSGPSNQTAMPSFYLALDAVQRTRKRRSM